MAVFIARLSLPIAVLAALSLLPAGQAVAAGGMGGGSSGAVAAGHLARPSVSVGRDRAERTSAGNATLPACFYTVPSCASVDPTTTFSLFSDGDTSGCTFDGQVSWGDGSPVTDVGFGGGADGTKLVTFSHTFAKAGTYSIGWSADVTSGTTCQDNSGTLQFTLVNPLTLTEQGGASNPSENKVNCSSSAPVNCATGVFWHQFTDFSVPGRGVPLDLTRTYSSSRAADSGPFGNGWTDSYEMSLAIDSSGNATITQEDGSTVTFQAGGASGFTAPPQVLATLTKNADGSYTFLRERGQTRYTFSAAGRLTSETDLNGYVTSLAYNASGQLLTVTDPAGRQLKFSYAGAHVSAVTGPMGRKWSYSYDSGGNLTRAADPMGRVWAFTYSAAHRMLAMTDPRGGKTVSTYNASGQVTVQANPGGGKTTWSYSGNPATLAGSTTTMTDPAGRVTKYQYSDLELLSVTQGAGTVAAATTTYIYDPLTLGVASVTDPKGNVTTSTYDASGNLLTTTDPLGHTTSYSYNSLNEMLSKTTPLGETTSYGYDANGNLLTQTGPLGGVTSYSYADSAHPGDITALTDPDGHVTTYAYDKDGDLASITQTPAAGITDTTVYGYDAAGDRTCQASANATAAHIACPAAGTTVTAYNADGEATSVTDPDGHVTRYAYDAGAETIRITDPAGGVTSYTYDANGRQTKTSRPGGSTVTSAYDADGNLIRQVNGAGDVSRYSYDALSRQTSVTSPLGQATTYGYDPDGNRIKLTDPSGRVTSYSYNADSQLTRIGYSDGKTPVVSYGYDADGRRVSMTDGTGTTSYSYDAAGRLTSVADGAGATVSYGYDQAGLLTTLTYPNEDMVTRGYDGAGQVTSITDWLGHVTKFGYDADGDLATEAYPNGITAVSGYDMAGQLMSITDKTGSATLARFAYTRNSRSEVTSATGSGALPGTRDYSYTQLSQLSSDSGGRYGYSASGSVTALPGGITQAYNVAGELTSATRTVPAKPAAVAQLVSANETKGAKLTAPKLTTKAAGELILAFVSAGGPANATQSVSSVTGGGLTWSRAARSDQQRGTAEVWQAYAGKTLSGVTITAALARKGYDGSITVVTFAGARTVTGARAAAAAASGAPGVALTTTRAQSLVWAVGEDPSRAVARKAVAGQAVRHQFLDAGGKSTDWVQATGVIALAGTRAKVADTAPATDKWNMAAVEVTAAPAAGVRTTYGYDKDGNRTSVALPGKTATALSYDQANRLTGFGATARYTYNGDSLRMSKTVNGVTTAFAWDQSWSVPLVLAAGSTYYVYGPDGEPVEQVTNGVPMYLLADQQGSTRLLANAAGSVAGSYSYGSYGEVTRHTGAATALTYDGQYTDAETGFQYLRARYYDPATAQFISVDPANALTLAPYGYAADNPVNMTDPGGEFAQVLLGGLIGAVVGAGGGVLNYYLNPSPNKSFWGSVAGGAAGGFVGGACVGVDPLLAGACGAAGGAVNDFVQQQFFGQQKTAQDYAEDSAAGFVGGWLGGSAFKTVGFLPSKLSNLWAPGVNATREYYQALVGAVAGLVPNIITILCQRLGPLPSYLGGIVPG